MSFRRSKATEKSPPLDISPKLDMTSGNTKKRWMSFRKTAVGQSLFGFRSIATSAKYAGVGQAATEKSPLLDVSPKLDMTSENTKKPRMSFRRTAVGQSLFGFRNSVTLAKHAGVRQAATEKSLILLDFLHGPRLSLHRGFSDIGTLSPIV